MTLQGMYRIAARDADALGEANKSIDEKVPNGGKPADEDDIRENLKSVFDPEIPVNVVDLGLIIGSKLNQLKIEDELHLLI